MKMEMIAELLLVGALIVVLVFFLVRVGAERAEALVALEQIENALATSQAQTKHAIANTARGIALVEELMEICNPDRTEQEQSGKIRLDKR